MIINVNYRHIPAVLPDFDVDKYVLNRCKTGAKHQAQKFGMLG